MKPPRPDPSGPTVRQAEYLAFLRTFTDRWGIPPSFEEIGRHFSTTAPSVNNMLKTLERRGFITRVPGKARTLRVLLPEASSAPAPAPRGDAAPGAGTKAVVDLACMVIERLVPALKDAGVGEQPLWKALDAVGEALEAACLAAGASPREREEAQATIERIATIAGGSSTERRPGRRLPWWRRPR